QTFTATAPILNLCPSRGDLSAAWAPSGGPNGTFFVSYLKDTACLNQPAHAIGIVSSTNRGPQFVVSTNSFAGAVPQPHIAVAPRPAPTGPARIYVVFKSQAQPLGVEQAAIVCSGNSGQSWSQAAAVGAMGDNYPRVTVGGDGTVYVVSRAVSTANVRIWTFAPCATNSALAAGPSWF